MVGHISACLFHVLWLLVNCVYRMYLDTNHDQEVNRRAKRFIKHIIIEVGTRN